MDQGQGHKLACVLCGTEKGSYKFYHDARDQELYLCVDCLQSASKSLTRDQLAEMDVARLRRHMEVRDELAATYRDSFVPTRTFCVGKRRNVPIIEVDEERGLWALPKASMPLAQSIGSIVDVEVSLYADELGEDEDLAEELVEGVTLKDLLPFVRTFISSLYSSKHTDLAPIPEGQLVSYLYLILTLDDRESGIGRVEIDLLPFLFCWPSHVNAGYDCAYDLIAFLKQLASDAYGKERATGKGLDLSCNERLAMLADEGLMPIDDAEVLRYYLERMPPRGGTGATWTSYGLVWSVVDAVLEHLVFGEKAPELATWHTVGAEIFLGAFYRYAPGLAMSDVVYIRDSTSLHSGKGGLLFAQESFAVDNFATGLGEQKGLVQPIRYDDLLFVGMGESKGRLVLAYRDGRRIEVNGGKYAHFVFAAVNCILMLRSS